MYLNANSPDDPNLVMLISSQIFREVIVRWVAVIVLRLGACSDDSLCCQVDDMSETSRGINE